MLFTIVRHGYTYMYLMLTFPSCAQMLKLFNFSIFAFYTGMNFSWYKIYFDLSPCYFFSFRNNNIIWQVMVGSRKIRQYMLQPV